MGVVGGPGVVAIEGDVDAEAEGEVLDDGASLDLVGCGLGLAPVVGVPGVVFVADFVFVCSGLEVLCLEGWPFVVEEVVVGDGVGGADDGDGCGGVG